MPTTPRLAFRFSWPLLLIAASTLALLIYLPGLQGPYVFDDYVNIVQNASLNLPDLSWHSLLDAAFSLDAGPLMRPVSMLSFAFNRYLFGVEPFSFKLVNLFIHLANGALVFLLLRRILAAYRQLHAPELAPQSLDWLAAVTATLWLVHPLNLTAVLYVVQRETSLSALFVLAGVNLYAWVRFRQLNGRSMTWLLFPGTALFGALAILSKESGALMPCYMLAVEVGIFRFRCPNRNTTWQLAGFYLTFLILPGLLGLIWIFGMGHTGLLSYASRDFTLSQRLLTETRVIWLYIFWTLLPRISSLSLYHDDIPLSHDLIHPFTTLPACCGILALIVLAIAVRRRHPLVTFGIAWFFVGQLMESTI
ncbi:MAG: tetratricopeptide repeat protein, partial [Gammaproteobacteria bacterium]